MTGPSRPACPIFSTKYDYNTARQYGLLYGQSVAINPALQENYNTNAKGFTIFGTYPLRHLSFARLGVNYGFSTTNITTFSQSASLLFELTKFTSLAGPSALNGIPLEQNQPVDLLQHGEQPDQSDGRKRICGGAEHGRRPAGRER